MILFAALTGAAFDFIYWRRGGAKTPKHNIRQFQLALLGIIVVAAIGAVRSGGYASGAESRLPRPAYLELS